MRLEHENGTRDAIGARLGHHDAAHDGQEVGQVIGHLQHDDRQGDGEPAHACGTRVRGGNPIPRDGPKESDLHLHSYLHYLHKSKETCFFIIFLPRSSGCG